MLVKKSLKPWQALALLAIVGITVFVVTHLMTEQHTVVNADGTSTTSTRFTFLKS